MSVGSTFNDICHILETLAAFLKYNDDYLLQTFFFTLNYSLKAKTDMYTILGMQCLLLSNSIIM
jgi:hypothetical protein